MSHDHDHEHDHDEPQTPLAATPSHGYWKSLHELDGKAGWQLQPSTKEFPPGADQAPIDLMSRRNLFHLMGASMALAGVAGPGCRRYEKEEIVPLSRRPEDQIPGTTLQYATTFELGGVAHALIATSFVPRLRGAAIGAWAGVSSSALAIGPLFGALLENSLG